MTSGFAASPERLAGQPHEVFAVAARIPDLTAENRRSLPAGAGTAQHLGQAVTVEQVVAEHERAGVVPDELPADWRPRTR